MDPVSGPPVVLKNDPPNEFQLFCPSLAVLGNN